MNIMALIVGTVYLITKRQSERCFNNVNEFNTLMSAILVRQALIAQHTGLVLPSLDEMQNECMVTLALKIVDDTCKMDDYERSVFMKLYDALPEYKSVFFDDEIFAIIALGREKPTAQIFATIKPLREAGMEYVSRPHMKAFKAEIRRLLSV